MSRRSRGTSGTTDRAGSRVALAVLAILLIVRVFDPPAVAAVRLRLFDLYQRLAPVATAAPSVIVVDIDDASLARYGQWPWPRNLIARLVDRLAEAGASGVGMDVLFPEPDRMNARSLLDSIPAIDAETRRAVESLPDGDRSLAASFKALPVVLGTAIDARVAPTDAPPVAGPPPTPPLVEQGGDPRPFLTRFDRLVRNLSILTGASAGTGVVSLPLEPDGVVRRVPLVIAVGNSVLPTLALEMARVVGGGGPVTLRSGGQGLQSIEVELELGSPARGDRLSLSTDTRGRIWIHYGLAERARYVSAAALLDGTIPPERISGRLVLVGATAAGLMDLHPTPLGLPMPGVEIHAQLLENLLRGEVLNRPALATVGELVLCAAVGLAIILLRGRAANRWLVALWGGTSLLVIYGAWTAYASHDLLIDGVYPVFVATVVCAVAVAASFVAARREAEARLREREARLRALQAELLDVSRRSAVAQLSSALAHELNQPLSAIGNYVQACRRMLTGGGDRATDKVYGYLDRAIGQVERAAAIITGLRDIVERGQTVRAPEDVNPVLEEAVATALLGARTAPVSVEQRYAGGLHRVQINRIQIQQVVLNLVRNAVEAMAASPRRVLTVETRAAEDGAVEVAIGDTGPGLSAEVEARLFRPVASTKEAGMGVGLSISKSIVEAHGGRIWATRNAAGGMTFHFTLPRAAD